jgi:hypothetical protein
VVRVDEGLVVFVVHQMGQVASLFFKGEVDLVVT